MSLDSLLRATGKNLANCGEKANWYSPISYLTNLTVSDGVVSLPAVSAGSGMAINKNRVFTNGETFTIHANHTSPTGDVPANQYRYILKPYKNNTVVKDITITGWTYNQYYNAYWSSGFSKSFTLPKDTVNSFEWGLGFLAHGDISAGTVLTYSNIQIEKGSTATTYEPYEYLGPKTIKMSSNSKNLIPYPYATTSKTISGVTFTVQEDGGIKVEGTPNNPVSMFYISTPANTISALKIGNTYTLSGYRSGSGATLFYKNTEVSDSYTFTCDAQNPLIGIKVIQGTAADALFYPQLEEGSVATDYELNTGSKEVLKVSYNSRNFFDINNIYSPLNTDTYEISDNKLKVYRNRAYVVGVSYRIPLPVGTQYTLYYDIEYGGTATGIYNYADSKIFNGSPNKVNYTGTVGDTGYLKLEFSRIGGENDKLGWVIYSNIQVELGNKKTDYVPYFNTVVWTYKQPVLTGYNITSTNNDDGTQSLNIVDATSTTDQYNITSTDNSDGTQTLNITDA